jgi:D-aminoacyl-tRNA deacylase
LWSKKLKAVVQRVNNAVVDIPEDNYSAKIGRGMLILLGIKTGDTIEDTIFVADKCSNLRIFSRRDAFAEDENGKMNISIKEINGEAMVISQFTLYGETAKGNRPSFIEAAKPDEAIPLYEKFLDRMRENLGSNKIKSGIFGAMMDVTLTNSGPVTLIVNSK